MSGPKTMHNSVYNSRNGDDYIKGLDHVTLISKLDTSDPLHLHPNDTTVLTVVSIKLKGTKNPQVWSCAMLLALEGKNKTSFIDETYKRSNLDVVLGRQWDRAEHVWEELKETYDKVDGSTMFSLHHHINTLKLNGSSIDDYYHTLNALWKQFDDIIELPKCVCNASEDLVHLLGTDKQMATLISLIKDNKNGKNVQANMVAKENKIDVAFDEVYFLNQDLSLRSVLGTGSQCEGLYYYNDKGDLVHLDLWGPYKVTSSEGFRYFLTILDDYTRAV
nr:putative Gag-polypeptide of LTR copia-type [Tanacetum cinerariifolium]